MTLSNDIKKAFDLLINFPQQGSYTPDGLDIWMYNAVIGLYKQRLGLPEQMEFQTAVPKIAYARTKKIHDDLKPYRKFKNIALPNQEFLSNSLLPADLLFETNLYYTTVIRIDDKRSENQLRGCGCTEQVTDVPEYKKFLGEIKLVQEDKWTNRVNSPILKTAIYCPFADGFKLYFPIGTVTNIRIEYLEAPKRPHWGYTLVNDVPVYDPATSVNVAFNETLITEIVARMVKEYGLNVDDSMDIQFANQVIQQGQ